MDYFIAASKTVTLPNGRPYRLTRGIHAVPEALADHAAANIHGIKPVEEMTDAEWRSLGLKPPVVEIASAEPVEDDEHAAI